MFIKHQSQSIWAIVATSFLYVINDLRKKKRQFAIGISTIFITVSVVTFLDCLIGLAPVVTMVASQSTVGDFDLQLTRLKEADFVARGKHNFEIDSGFFEAGRNESRSFYDKMIKSNALPTLNYTYFSETLKQQDDVSVRLFPRWNALSKVWNTKTGQSTSAIMVAGDSNLENSVKVAKGFPMVNLEEDEMIILQDVLDVLELKKGDWVEVQYDIL